MLGASPYPLSVARLAFNLTKVRGVCYDRTIARGDKEKESKMLKFKELKFKELNQCQQCGDLVNSGVNVTPSITDWMNLTWVCQDCSREWEV
jgi:hypothetical protein